MVDGGPHFPALRDCSIARKHGTLIPSEGNALCAFHASAEDAHRSFLPMIRFSPDIRQLEKANSRGASLG